MFKMILKYINVLTLHSSQHLSVVAIEKGAFGLPLTTVANFTYFYLLVNKMYDFSIFFSPKF